MCEIKAPSSLSSIDFTKEKTVFLAGSIEMGKAEIWQTKIASSLKDTDWIVLNPRRDDWDSSWVQTIENKQFREQVEWELEAQEKAQTIVMYFDPTTKSPITLLELGLFCFKNLIVCCPEGFWRRGNVCIVCKRYGIKQVETIEELAKEIRNCLFWSRRK